jgi:hypothetical protein
VATVSVFLTVASTCDKRLPRTRYATIGYELRQEFAPARDKCGNFGARRRQDTSDILTVFESPLDMTIICVNIPPELFSTLLNK